MNIKEWFRSNPYWLKGGIIGTSIEVFVQYLHIQKN